MSDQIAIITGAGRGIGRATAIELSRRQYHVALVSRTAGELEETARLCAGGSAEVFAADVSQANQVEELIDRVMAKYGRVDAAVHSAGAVVMKSVEEISPVDWQMMIDTNLSAVYFLAHRLWPVWRKQGGGVMVNVSSEAARDPFAGLGAYGAAKAGVSLLGLALAREGAEINVRVHTVAPGATETAMLRSIITREQVPTEKTLATAAVARVIVQCICGELACTSGEVIYVHK